VVVEVELTTEEVVVLVVIEHLTTMRHQVVEVLRSLHYRLQQQLNIQSQLALVEMVVLLVLKVEALFFLL
jgi:hypothetical protein